MPHFSPLTWAAEKYSVQTPLTYWCSPATQKGMAKKPATAVVAFACEKAGSASELARKLGISKQAISQWTEIPIRHVHRVNEVTGIPLTDLRPDVFRGAAQ